MSAAITRATRVESETRELTPPSKTETSGELHAPPVIEVTRAAQADPGSSSEHGTTPLMRAACDGSAGTVRALLDLGADVNAKRLDGFNALALAAFFGHIHVVWLLLENGADPSETGRSQTTPEMWADARGFVDIGDVLREACSAKLLEATSPRTAVIDEPARFSRPPEEVPQHAPAVIPEPQQTSKILPEIIESRPLTAVVDEPARFSRPVEEVPQHALQPAVIPEPQQTSKILPEIIDPPPLVVPAFHPGSVFVARITSSRRNLLALTLVVLLVCAGTAGLLIPRIRQSLTQGQNAVTKSTNPTTDSASSSSGSGSSVSASVDTPAAATANSTTRPASNHNGENASVSTADTPRIDPTLRVESTEETAADSSGLRWRAYSRSTPSTAGTVTEPSQNNREFSATTSETSSGVSPRRKLVVSRVPISSQKSATDEEPKPAPLTVEMTRSSNVLPPARNTREVSGSQPPPLGIISDKPKPKVIQWP